jgi:hypothetical protein
MLKNVYNLKYYNGCIREYNTEILSKDACISLHSERSYGCGHFEEVSFVGHHVVDKILLKNVGC